MWERKIFVFRRKKFQKHKKYVYFNKSLACQRSSKRPLQIGLQTKSQMNITFNGIIVRNVLIPQDFLQHGLSFGLPAWVFKGFILNFAFLIMWPPRPLWAPHLPYLGNFHKRKFVFRRKKFQKHKKYVYFNKSLEPVGEALKDHCRWRCKPKVKWISPLTE